MDMDSLNLKIEPQDSAQIKYSFALEFFHGLSSKLNLAGNWKGIISRLVLMGHHIRKDANICLSSKAAVQPYLTYYIARST